MSSLNSVRSMQPGRTALRLREQYPRPVAGVDRKAVVERLRRFRERLERDMAPDPWTGLEGPMVLLLSDVCRALGLSQPDRDSVKGQHGQRALAEVLEIRVAPRSRPILNERQARALDFAEEHSRIDLVNLVVRGLLAKNGRKRGTYYTLAARSQGER